ncbi:hypothetical protein ACUNGP_22980 [Serratia sp. IR-2025]
MLNGVFSIEMPHYQCLTTPFPEHWTGREELAWLTGEEMGDMNPKKRGNKLKIAPFISLPTHYKRPAFGKGKGKSKGKGKGKGMALKGITALSRKGKDSPVHSFCNIQPTLLYAVPLPSAALR